MLSVSGHLDRDRRERLGTVQSLTRALGLLDELAKAEGMALSEIVRSVKLPRSTAHRLLTTMEAMGYVRFDRTTNAWRIGVQAFAVGSAFVQTRDLGQIGRSVMRSLMGEVRHSVNLAIPESGGMCYIGQVAVEGGRPSGVRPGASLPMHTTATGKVLMAHWTGQEIDRFLDQHELRARTGRTISAPRELKDELAVVRERGFAIDDEEHAVGLRCVAGVVLDRYGMPKAALSLSDTTLRLRPERLLELGPTLMRAAGQLSGEISFQVPS